MSDILNRDELVRLTTVVGSLVDEVRTLGEKVDSLRDDHIYELERKMAVLTVQNDAANERLQKVEGHFGWMVKTVIGEGLALVAGIVMWVIQNYK